MMAKLKTKSFWMSLAAAVILVLQSLGIKVDVPYVDTVMESICTLLLILGIFTAPAPEAKKPSEQLTESVEIKEKAPDKAENSALPEIDNNF